MQKYIEILLEGDEKATGEWVAFGKAKVNAIRATGVKYAVRTYPVTDRITIYVRVSPQYDKIRIVEGGCDPYETALVDTYTLWPRGSIDRDTNEQIELKEQEDVADGGKPKFWKLAKYVKPENLPPAVQDKASYILPAKSENEDWLSHYLAHYPSLYSGKMRKLAQTSLGTEYWDGSSEEQTFPFQHSWPVTHGLYTTSDDKVWGIEINEDGVYRFPVTVCKGTHKFRKDDENEAAVDTLLLVDYDLDAKVLIGAAPGALDGSPLVNGWAFSESGAKAGHVLFTDGDNGYRISTFWEVSITEGTLDAGTPNERKAPVSAGYTSGTTGTFYARHDPNLGLLHVPKNKPEEEDYTIVTQNTYDVSADNPGNTSAPVYVWYKDETAQVVMMHYQQARIENQTLTAPDVRNCADQQILVFGDVSGAYTYTYPEATAFTINAELPDFGVVQKQFVGTTREDQGGITVVGVGYPYIIRGTTPTCETQATLQYTNTRTGNIATQSFGTAKAYGQGWFYAYTTNRVDAHSQVIQSFTVPLFERQAGVFAKNRRDTTASEARTYTTRSNYIDYDDKKGYFDSRLQAPEFTFGIVQQYFDFVSIDQPCDVWVLTNVSGAQSDRTTGKVSFNQITADFVDLGIDVVTPCYTQYELVQTGVELPPLPANTTTFSAVTTETTAELRANDYIQSLTQPTQFFERHLPPPSERYVFKASFAAYRPVDFNFVTNSPYVVNFEDITYTPQYLTQGWIGAV